MESENLDRPAGAAHDWTIPQGWERYTEAEHAMWDTLFDRQAKMLPGRVAPEFLDGLDILRLSKPGIPNFDELNERLMQATGWQVVAVPGLVPDDIFFDHRSEEHTSELQSLMRISYAVFCLKKNKIETYPLRAKITIQQIKYQYPTDKQ